jgi:DNA-binding response OmpR family regulator
MAQSQQILIVSSGSEPGRMRRLLEDRGFKALIASDYESAFEELRSSRFDLVAVDAGAAGPVIDFIKRVRALPEMATTLILILAEWGTGQPTLALSAGADAYEPRDENGFEAARVVTSIERLLNRQAAAANSESL